MKKNKVFLRGLLIFFVFFLGITINNNNHNLRNDYNGEETNIVETNENLENEGYDEHNLLFNEETEGEEEISNDGIVKLNASNPKNYAYLVINGSTQTYVGSIATVASSHVRSGTTIKLTRNVIVEAQGPYRLGSRGTNNITFDLNGYNITYTGTGNFLEIKGHMSKIISSRPNGNIITQGNGSAVLLSGESNNWRPRLTIGENVTISSNGDSAVRNQNGHLIIDGATLKSSQFYAIQTYYVSGGNQVPILEIHNNKSNVYGIHGGNRNTNDYVGNIVITGGYIHDSLHAGDPGVFRAKSTHYNVQITGGYVRQNMRHQLENVNKSGQYEYVFSHYEASINKNWWLMKRYGVANYQSNGGTRADGSTPLSEKHYLGETFSFPNDMEYRKNQGVTFAGWYTDSNFITGSGPYTHRNINNSDNRTYYARFTYQVNYHANDDEQNQAIYSNGARATTVSNTLNAGHQIYNTLLNPSYTRPGYEFIGWSRNQNIDPDADLGISRLTTRWNYDAGVSDGKVDLYAVWKPVERGSTYRVEYYLEDLAGNFKHDPSRDTRFFSTAGATSNPNTNINLDYYVISNDQSHIDLRQQFVKGNGSTVVKLYYKLKTYEVKFHIDTKVLNVTNYNEDDYTLIANDNNSTITIMAKHGGNVVGPTFTHNSNRLGYRGTYWGGGSLQNITSNLELTLNWVEQTYTYTYVWNNPADNISTNTQTFGKDFIRPSGFNYPGRTFYAWYTDEERTELFDTSLIPHKYDVTLYAKYSYGTPSSPINLIQQTNKALIFTNYSNYQYRLKDVATNEYVGDWIKAGGNKFKDLTPNREYELEVRIPGDDNFEVSPVVTVGRFKTFANMNTTIKVEDNKMLVIEPKENVKYIVKDKSNNSINPTLNTNGQLFFEVNPETEYDIYYEIDGVEVKLTLDELKDEKGNTYTSPIKTKTPPSTFVGENYEPMDIVANSDNITMTANDNYEYALSENGPWISPKDSSLVFDNLEEQTEYQLYVRNKETDTNMPSNPEYINLSLITKGTGIVPNENSKKHVIETIEGKEYIEVKPGFNYYDGNDTLISNYEEIDGKKYIEFNENLKLSQKENDFYTESATTLVEGIVKPMLELKDQAITVLVDENRIILSGLIDNVTYELRDQAGNVIFGYLNNENELVFNNLDYATTYELYAKKQVGDYETDFTEIKTIITDKKYISLDDLEDSSLIPKLDYVINYDEDTKTFTATIDTKEDVEYSLDGGITWIKGPEIISIDSLNPVSVEEIALRINNDKEYSNTIYDYIYVPKVPKEHVEVAQHEINDKTYTDDYILINGLNNDYEYAIRPIGSTDENLEFSNPINESLEFTDLDYKTKYEIVYRVPETNTHESSSIHIGLEFETLRLPTSKRPGISDEEVLDNLKALINKTPTSLEVLEYEDIEFSVVKEVSSEEGTETETTHDFRNSYLNGNVEIGEVYYIYVKLVANDKEEESQIVLLEVITITKDEQTLDELNIETVSVADQSIIFKGQNGYEYAIREANDSNEPNIWVKGYNGNLIFDNLNPNSEYEIVARLIETDVLNPSNFVVGATKTTLKLASNKVTPPTSLIIGESTNSTIEIETEVGIEYSIDNINFIIGDGNNYTFTNLNSNTNYNIYYRYSETEDNETSGSVVGLEISTKLDNPTFENSILNLTTTENSISFELNSNYSYGYNGNLVETLFELIDLEPGKIITIEVTNPENNEKVEFDITTKSKEIVEENDKTLEDLVILDDEISFNAKVGFEYAIKINDEYIQGEVINDLITFANLDPVTYYEIYIKKLASDDTKVDSDYVLASTPKTTKVPTEKVKEITIEEQNHPEALIEYDGDTKMISFEGKYGFEYSVDGINFYEENMVLEVNNDQEILMRRVETNKEEPSKTAIVTFKKETIDVSVPNDLEREVEVEVKDTSIIFNGKEGLEYSVDGINYFEGEIVTINDLNPNTQYEIKVRRKLTETELYSNDVSAIITNNNNESFVKTLKTLIDIKDNDLFVNGISEENVSFAGDDNTYYLMVESGSEEPTNKDMFTNTPEFTIDLNKSYDVYAYYEDDSSFSEITKLTNIIPFDVSNLVVDVTEVNATSIEIDTLSFLDYRLISVETGLPVTNTNRVFNVLPNHTYEIQVKGEHDFIDKLPYQTIENIFNNETSLTITTPKLAASDIPDEERFIEVDSEGIIVPRLGYEFTVVKETEELSPDAVYQTSDLQVESTDKIYMRKVETDNTYASEPVLVEAKSASPNPAELNVIYGDMSYDKLSFEIDNDNNYEYSVDGINFIKVSEDNKLLFENLNPNTIYNLYIRNIVENHAPSNLITIATALTSEYDLTKDILDNYIIDNNYEALYDDLINALDNELLRSSNINEINNEIEKAKLAIDRLEALRISTNELETYSDMSDVVDALISEALIEINNRTDADGVITTKEVYIDKILNQLAAELQVAKDNKIAEIENLKNIYNEADYSEDNYQLIENIIEDAIAEINSFDKVSDVINFDLIKLEDDLNEVLTIQESLDQAKETAIAEIEAEYAKLNKEDYTPENWDIFEADKLAAINKVNAATNLSEVDAALNEGLVIRDLETIEETNLREATEAVETLFKDETDIKDGLTQEDINSAQELIDKLTDGEDKTELENKLADAQTQLNERNAAKELEEAKSAAITEIEAEYAKLNEEDYTPENWDIFEADKLAAINNVNAATTEEDVEIALEEGLVIRDLETIEETNLREATEAVNELFDEETIKPDTNQAAIDSAKLLVDNLAESDNKTDLLAKLTNAQSQLNAKLEAEAALEEAKQTAIAEIEYEYENLNESDYSPSKWDELVTRKENAINNLKNAKTIDEVETTKDEGIDSLEKVYTIIDEELIDEVTGSTNKLFDDNNKLKDDISQDDIDKAKLDIDKLKDGEEKTELENIINEAEKELHLNIAIDENTTKFDEEILELLDISSKDNLTPEMQSLIDEALNALIEADDILDLPNIYDEYLEKVSEFNTFENLLEELANKFNLYANDNGYQYNEEGQNQLLDIFNIAETNIDDDNLSTLDKISIIEDAIAELSKVPKATIGSFNPKDPTFNISDLDQEDFNGVIETKVPIQSDAKVIVVNVKVNVSNVNSIYTHIQNEVIIPKFNEQTKTELQTVLREQIIFAQFDIKLVDENDNELEHIEGNEYLITLLLPTEFRNRTNIKVVYMNEDNVEVFGTTRDGDWITFTTDHFSSYYLIGDPIENEESPLIEKLNLWWIIIILTVVIILEVIWIIWKRDKNAKQLNSFALPVLAIIIPTNAYLIITILIGIIILLALYIIYLYIVEKNKDKIEELETEKLEDVKEVEKVVVIEKEQPQATIQASTLQEQLSIRYNYSLLARLHQAPDESIKRYNEIKNHILSYDDVVDSMQWKYEGFIYKGRTAVKLTLQGQTMRAYFDLQYEDLIDTKYNLTHITSKTHETTPVMLKLKGPRGVKHAIELIDLTFNKLEVEQKELPNVNYKLPYYDRETLFKMNLIKVVIRKKE